MARPQPDACRQLQHHQYRGAPEGAHPARNPSGVQHGHAGDFGGDFLPPRHRARRNLPPAPRQGRCGRGHPAHDERRTQPPAHSKQRRKKLGRRLRDSRRHRQRRCVRPARRQRHTPVLLPQKRRDHSVRLRARAAHDGFRSRQVRHKGGRPRQRVCHKERRNLVRAALQARRKEGVLHV